MMCPNRNRFFVGTVLVFGVVTAMAIVTRHLNAQPKIEFDDSPVAEPEKAKADFDFQVGTYDQQTAFQKHPVQKDLMKSLRTAQTEMQAAQEEGDQQRMRQVQQKYEQARERAVEKFQQDTARAVPEVAESTGVKVVAVEIVYTAEDVRTKDITPQLVEAFGDDESKQRQSPAVVPRLPRQQQ